MNDKPVDQYSAEQRMLRYRLIGAIGHEVLYLSNDDMGKVLDFVVELVRKSGIADE